MQITDVRIRKINAGKLLAIASVTMDREFVVHDFKIFTGTKGLFVSMPSIKTREGEYRDTAHPVTKQTRELLNTAILDAYKIA